MTHRCTPECVTWVGTNKCHCSGCGETFTNVTNFDLHQGTGKCLPPDAVGLEQSARGVWRVPGEVDFDERFGKRQLSSVQDEDE